MLAGTCKNKKLWYVKILVSCHILDLFPTWGIDPGTKLCNFKWNHKNVVISLVYQNYDLNLNTMYELWGMI